MRKMSDQTVSQYIKEFAKMEQDVQSRLDRIETLLAKLPATKEKKDFERTLIRIPQLGQDQIKIHELGKHNFDTAAYLARSVRKAYESKFNLLEKLETAVNDAVNLESHKQKTTDKVTSRTDNPPARPPAAWTRAAQHQVPALLATAKELINELSDKDTKRRLLVDHAALEQLSNDKTLQLDPKGQKQLETNIIKAIDILKSQAKEAKSSEAAPPSNRTQQTR